MSGTRPQDVRVVDTSGRPIDPSDQASATTAITYNVDGTINTITKTYASGAVSTKTFSYSGGNLVGIATVVT